MNETPTIDAEAVASALGRKIGALHVENEQLRAALSAVSEAFRREQGRVADLTADKERLNAQLASVVAERATPIAADEEPGARTI